MEELYTMAKRNNHEINHQFKLYRYNKESIYGLYMNKLFLLSDSQLK